jgi:hypothetical protein
MHARRRLLVILLGLGTLAGYGWEFKQHHRGHWRDGGSCHMRSEAPPDGPR